MNTYGKTFNIIANIVLVILSLSCVIPLILLLTSSFTSESALMQYGYTLFPKEFSLDAYHYLWYSRAQILTAYKMTLLATSVGTLSNVAITTLMAYPLSRKSLPGRNFFSFAIFFTLLFNGGMVPSYLMWTQVFGIKDTFWALILPNLLMNGFGVIVMRTYFTTSIPNEILEAARIDGATGWKTFRYITLPLLAPTTLFVSTIAFTNCFKLADHVIIMTEGAPNNASTLLLYYIYQQGFTNLNYGVSSALTVMMLALLMVVSLPRFFSQDKKIHYA